MGINAHALGPVRRTAIRLAARLSGLCIVIIVALLPTGAPASEALDEGPSGLPLPRFVSLKSNEVNVRGGPGTDYRIRWIFKKAGLPVEIVQEFSNWRRIRDAEGEDGWVHRSLLAADRTVLVVPWEVTEAEEGRDGPAEPVDLHAQPDRSSRVVAQIEPNVLAAVRSCDGRWCLIAGTNWDGFVEQDLLWGVYPGEVFE